jgi:hypothetical protein
MVESKTFANFIVEPLGSNIHSPTSFMVRKSFQDLETTTTYTSVDTMFSDIMLEATRPTTHGSSNMKGALVYLKNGTYVPTIGTIIISDTTDDDNVMCHIVGQTRDQTIIKCGFTTGMETQIIHPYCSLDVENLTINCDSKGTFIAGIYPEAAGTATKILRVNNCRFQNMTSFDIITPHNQYAVEISNCIFEKHQNDVSKDQVAFECTHHAHIHDNIFDHTVGSVVGSSLTSGSAFNADIHDNIILRADGNPNFGISMEPYDVNDNYENIFIHDNFIQGGRINIGKEGVWTRTFRNVYVTGNTLYKGGIYVEGPTTGYTDIIKDVAVENNQLFDSWEAGIHINKVGGFCAVRNNTIKNSNKSLATFTGQEPLIYLQSSIDVVCENNLLYMGVVSPDVADFSPQGIRYVDLVDPTIRNNRILNRTVANNSYESIGTHTGSVLISRSS